MPLWVRDILQVMKNIMDILLVAYIIYRIMLLVKDTRAQQMLIGLLAILVAFFFTDILRFDTLNWILSNFFASIILIVIILFQDDIRRGLAQVGRSSIFYNPKVVSEIAVIEEVIKAGAVMSTKKIGALIVLERKNRLEHHVEMGTIVDAEVKSDLLQSIFLPYSPLHDGAVIIRHGRIYAAGCVLPLSTNPNIIKGLGTRHRAALGISEVTDAAVIVISEEAGAISLVYGNRLNINLTTSELRNLLINIFELSQEKLPTKNNIEKIKGKYEKGPTL